MNLYEVLTTGVAASTKTKRKRKSILVSTTPVAVTTTAAAAATSVTTTKKTTKTVPAKRRAIVASRKIQPTLFRYKKYVFDKEGKWPSFLKDCTQREIFASDSDIFDRERWDVFLNIHMNLAYLNNLKFNMRTIVRECDKFSSNFRKSQNKHIRGLRKQKTESETSYENESPIIMNIGYSCVENSQNNNNIFLINIAKFLDNRIDIAETSAVDRILYRRLYFVILLILIYVNEIRRRFIYTNIFLHLERDIIFLRKVFNLPHILLFFFENIYLYDI